MIFGIERYLGILKTSLFAELTEEETKSLINNVDIFQGERSTRVTREESPGHIYFLLDGEASLRLKSGVEVGRVGVGQSFELKTLLIRDQAWQFEWILEKNSVLMKVPWPAFESTLKNHPQFYQYLIRVSQSVALQRLKRDLNGLGLPRNAVIEIVSSLHLEPVESLFSDWSRKIFFTIQDGELIASVQFNDQKCKVAYLQAGDTSLIDLKTSKLTYESEDATRAWVLYENEWNELKCQVEFNRFLQVFDLYRDNDADFGPVESTRLHSLGGNPARSATAVERHSSDFSVSSLWIWIWRNLFRPSMEASRDEGHKTVAVLSTVGKFFGYKLGMERITAKIQGLSSNQSFEALHLAAKSLGFHSEIRKSQGLPKNSSDWPAVVLLDSGFKVLFARSDTKALLGDPETGEVFKAQAQRIEQRMLDKKYLHLSPGPGLKNRPDPEIPFWSYASIILNYPYLIALFFVAGFLGFFFDLSSPVLNQYLFDVVISEKNPNLFYITIGGILVFSLLGAFTETFNQRLMTDLATNFNIRLKSLFMDRLLKMPVATVRQIGTSGILTRMQDIDAVGNFFARSLLHSFLSLFLMAGSLSVLWLYHYKLVYLVLIFVPIEAVLVRMMKRSLEDTKLELNQLKSRENRMIVEHFTSSESMRSLKGQLTSRWRWDVNALRSAKNLKRSGFLTAVFQVFHFLVGELVKIICFLAAVKFYLDGELTLGQLVGTSLLVPKISQPIQELISSYFQYFSIRPILTRMNDVIYAPVEPLNISSETKAKVSVPLRGDIRFENVSFGYDSSRPKTLNRINFHIRAGEKVAFIGPSGAGKSSIANLLSDLTQASEGEILIDGSEIGNYDLATLRNSIGVVEQDGMLFGGSIQENIGWGQNQHEIEKIQQAAQDAEVEEEILAKPGGFSAPIAPGGVGVSEGQKQRLLIARALYKKPAILVLDEATSHLDPIAEDKIINRVFDLYKDRTVIFFTQRIHLTMKADRIFYLEDGKVIESGTHQELIQVRKKYYEFFLLHLSLG